MSQTNFRAKDFKSGGYIASSKNDVAVKNEAPVAKPTDKPIIAPGADENDVPEGTVPEVLGWVGDDKERAQKALDKENENDKPRKGLVSGLEEILSEDEDEDKK